uniref:Uncharacterized protein n=1 Tax=Candidatus Kentrum sp. DK TaxID=2126562 RepID=A0A450TEW6_9GAMM|nr:MAG: hypothetical protein BECKDK2373B_GA0170837_105018 [Candidatus Kentron sp. DK]VFJ65656.1 MAG: hypothetical protein BECKDK2373C_GA0170839_11346 [Candidatus Kentron sp. DK]
MMESKNLIPYFPLDNVQHPNVPRNSRRAMTHYPSGRIGRPICQKCHYGDITVCQYRILTRIFHKSSIPGGHFHVGCHTIS